MNREEKNQQMQRRIMDSALAEFAKQGYSASSVNTICAAQGVSKGIIYHYFKNKDELYLSCVQECFQRLTGYLKSALLEEQEPAEKQLEAYFTQRISFFQANPVYQPIFCEAVIAPPAHLVPEIQERRKAFDAFTVETLERLLRPLPLRSHMSMEEVVELFRQFQDFINAQYRGAQFFSQDSFVLRDEHCRKMLEILLYGVVERRDQ